MKIGYVIAAYFGSRNVVHQNTLNDNLYYTKLQLQYIKKSLIKVDSIYIICTFDENQDSVSILNELKEITNDDNVFIQIQYRENLGGSYCSWKLALDIDDNDCDYILLLEDDYVMYDSNSIKYLLDYFDATPDLLYLCQYWMESAHHPPHAALSIGMINNKLYNKYKIENNIDFRLRYDPGYNVIVDNQINFLEGYRSNGIKIMHFADKYSAYYPHRDIDFGDKNGPIIFQPIISKYF